MEAPRTPPTQRLPGYELVDCLGAGAYGEVWRATAPGGLTKAIKYVFGQLDGKRATSELKSLERVKAVRHPYLLSLERIEVVDGRLIVVSELADACLRDRFRDCVQDGLPGIPRDELLRYLAEAAEALDHLASEHELQHLDVKPENLLLLAGHVKVADFGLVKSMNDHTQSIVGGMTPVYAAPEVFQGSPSWKSDQYSLAIMYQELLTGAPPFHGANAAELTMQHLKDEPDLSPLGEEDRFAVSQALSKSPENRFESCVRFIEALRSTTGVAPPAPVAQSGDTRPRPSTQTTENNSGYATEVFAFDGEQEGSPQPSVALELPAIEDASVRAPEPPACDAEDFRPAPAAFIGLGGIGGRVLAKLAGKIAQHTGVDTPLATLPMLYVDTDPDAIRDAVRDDLSAEQTLLLSLRRPQEYREKAPSILRWLSRRWLYNVPRSLRTEGIRPLGRLALLDHARRAMQRVRATLASAVAEESLAAAAADLGKPFDGQRLRVYVVASINGGAGGAMTTDIAYATRTILDRLGVADATITGLMINGSLRNADRSELTRVNAYAWMTEFQHFLRPDAAYPGDEGSGLPGYDAATPVFDNAYLLDLGEGLDANRLATGVDNAAEYLLQDTLTPMQAGLDACRAASNDPTGSLRTFHVRRPEATPAAELAAAANRLTNALAEQWCGDDPVASSDEPGTSPLVRDAATLVTRLQLDPAGLAAVCRTAVEQASPLAVPAPAKPAGFDQIAKALADNLHGEINTDLYRRLFDGSERLLGAAAAAGWYHEHLTSVDTRLTSLAGAVQEELKATPNQPPRALQVSLASLRVASLVTGQLLEALNHTRDNLAAFSAGFDRADHKPNADEQDACPADPGSELVESRLPDMLREADTLLAAALQTLTFDLLSGDRAKGVALFTENVDKVVEGVLERNLSGDADLTDGEEPAPLPRPTEWGAAVRRVVMAPQRPDTGCALLAGLGPAVHIESPNDASCAITECDELSLPHVAGSLVAGRRDYAELAARVVTRRDVEWTSPLDPPSDDEPPAAVAPSTEGDLDFTPTCVLPS